jgi:putative peptidoglycan lipid II flippase
VLGRGALGDTYETANTVPNIVFELFAAGALQAVLVPSLVEVLDRDGRRSAERFAGAVLGCLLALLGALAAIGIVAAPWLMRAVTSGTADPALHAAKTTLGTLFLWFFLPQVLFYAVGLVATAALNAEHSFNVPAIAPALNNVVVIATYLLFQALRSGAEPSLRLTGLEKVVLAGGTTLGVVAFTLLPALALARRGFRLRPHLDWHEPGVAVLARRGAWAGGQLALTQVLLAAVLVLANASPGGVVVWTFAFTFFLLPHSLFAVPVATTLYPGLARSYQSGLVERFGASLGRGVRASTVLVAGSAAALAALAWPIVRITAFGAARSGGLGPLAHAIVAFATGLVGYGLFYLLTRAAYAMGDARSPTIAMAFVTVVGLVAMVVAGHLAPLDERATALGAAFAGANLVGALALGVHVIRRIPRNARPALGAPVAQCILCALAAGVVMALTAGALDGRGRSGALATLVVAGAAGLAVYVGGLRLLSGQPVRSLVALDAGPGRG